MYYEETILNGVLHIKSHPQSPWRPASPQQLTKLYLESQEARRKLIEDLEVILGRIIPAEQLCP